MNYKLNKITDKGIGKTYTLIISASRDELKDFILKCINSYSYFFSDKELSEKGKEVLLKWHSTFYNIVRDRAENLGMDTSLYLKNPEDFIRVN